MTRKRFTHAGGIVGRRTKAGPRYLLVTARVNPAHWVFPKGHIERGETPADAARREVIEEAGVRATPIADAGSSTYTVPGKEKVHVVYFLMSFVSGRPASEGRALRWLPYAKARARLTFDEARRALRKAHEMFGASRRPVRRRRAGGRSARGRGGSRRRFSS